MSTFQTTVRDFAIENPASIRVFEKFGIDYCCGGRKPLHDTKFVVLKLRLAEWCHETEQELKRGCVFGK